MRTNTSPSYTKEQKLLKQRRWRSLYRLRPKLSDARFIGDEARAEELLLKILLAENPEFA